MYPPTGLNISHSPSRVVASAVIGQVASRLRQRLGVEPGAGVTQLVESLPPMQVVAGSSPVSRLRYRLGVELGSWAGKDVFIDLPLRLSSLGFYSQSGRHIIKMKGGDAMVKARKGK